MRLHRWLVVLSTERWFGYATALLSVALVSLVIELVDRFVFISNISMLYLIAVLVVSVAYGRGPAILASAAAFLTFNWLFIHPRSTFAVDDPAEWLGLVLLLLVGIICAQLAARERDRAREAEEREREAVVLYEVVRLLGESDLDSALCEVAERLRAELGLQAVAIEIDNDNGDTHRIVAGTTQLSRATWPAAADFEGGDGSDVVSRLATPSLHPCDQTSMDGQGRARVVPVITPHGRTGSLLLVAPVGSQELTASQERLLGTVATQLGVTVERDRLRHQATDAEVLRRADELKTALLNAVSHNLRTPLASIIASAGSLRQVGVECTREEQEELAEAIEEEGRRLDRIVGNLLDLSRMEGGSLRPHKEWHDLGALVDDVLGRLRPTTASHRVVVEVPDDLPPVPLDYVEIDQALSNLIENAAKYAPPGTEIRVAASAGDGEVRVEVCDEGPGIAEDSLPRLFEPFYRAVTGASRPKGTGLGLAVTKGLVEAHGGRVAAENLPVRGSRFSFTLPAVAPADASPVNAGVAH
ncbi:MAG: DUF4118 domain-containing protein [Chloroflexota bacterium]|nr:DUF4118 domain-containing protein [Chloroflexota bacterium]